MSQTLPTLTNNVQTLLTEYSDQSSIRELVYNSVYNEKFFPYSQSVVENIKKLIPNTTPKALRNLIYNDQFLALDIIRLANISTSNSYQTIKTISDIISVSGKSKILEILSDIPTQDYSSFFLNKATASTMLQQAQIASILARGIIKLIKPVKNFQEMTCSFSSLISLAPLALSICHPIAFSALNFDSSSSFKSLLTTFKELMGFPFGRCASQIGYALDLPPIYVEIAKYYTLIEKRNSLFQKENLNEYEAIAFAAFLAQKIAFEICSFSGIQSIQATIRSVDGLHFNGLDLEDAIALLPNIYIQQSENLGLKALRLPDYLVWFANIDDPDPKAWYRKIPPLNERIRPFISELRSISSQFINKNGFFKQGINCTLQALIKGLNFDRAVLLSLNQEQQTLNFTTSIGVKLFLPENISRDLNSNESQNMPDVQALKQGKVIFTGTPLFQDGWPFVAFPVIKNGEPIGVFYADKIRRPNGDALTPQEEIACVTLSEEWQELSKN